MYKKGAVLLMAGQLMVILCLFLLSRETKIEPVYHKSTIHMESMVHSASARRVLEINEIRFSFGVQESYYEFFGSEGA